MIAQEGAGEQEQVLEVEASVAAAPVRVVGDRGHHDGQSRRIAVLVPRLERGLDDVAAQGLVGRGQASGLA